MLSFSERSAETNATSRGSAHRPSDESLVEAVKGGHSAAFATLSERYRQQLFRAARRITRSCEDAEDAVQDTLLRAFVHVTDFDGRSSFGTWLTRIAINSALMILRKKRTSPKINKAPAWLLSRSLVTGSGCVGPGELPTPAAYSTLVLQFPTKFSWQTPQSKPTKEDQRKAFDAFVLENNLSSVEANFNLFKEGASVEHYAGASGIERAQYASEAAQARQHFLPEAVDRDRWFERRLPKREKSLGMDERQRGYEPFPGLSPREHH
jgi:RNA polymerase sigma factor (sigma-70 family)